MTTTTDATLNPSIVGQAEKAHNAVLFRALAGTTVDEEQWITLVLALGVGGAVDQPELVARVAGAAQFDPVVVEAAIGALTGVGFVQEVPRESRHLVVTEAGRAFVEQLGRTTRPIVARAYDGIPAEDLVTAARVLTAITAKLSAELAAT